MGNQINGCRLPGTDSFMFCEWDQLEKEMELKLRGERERELKLRPTIFTKMRCSEEQIKEGDVLLSWWGLNLYFGTWRPCYSCPQNPLVRSFQPLENAHLYSLTRSPNLTFFQWNKTSQLTSHNNTFICFFWNHNLVHVL